MTKGGARIPSDLFAVGKGMGLDRHYELLLLTKDSSQITVKEAIIQLNQRFAWWDDPNAQGPTETCRSYLKELWRLGLLERISPTSKRAIPVNPSTWRGGEQPPTYHLSKLGEYILSQNKDLFPYYVAWCIINACKNGIFPQVDKLFKLFEIEEYIPVNDDEHVKLTKKHNIYVEKHAGKAIKFGWLEPTGIIFRSSRNKFTLNQKFIRYLSAIGIEDLFRGIENESTKNSDIAITLKDKTLGITSFSNNSKYKFSIEITNNSNKNLTIKVKPYLFSIFSEISRISVTDEISLDSNEKKLLIFGLESRAIELSDSLMPSKIGFVEFKYNNKIYRLFLPQIAIMNEDHIWELELCDLFKQLDLKVFHLTGKSDRPDAVIDLSGLTSEPPDLLAYLRDESKEKILMETTLGEYSGSKLVNDTIKENTRGYNKFETHTQFVLKIAAVGQIIAAETFSKNVNRQFDSVKTKVDHTISLIDQNSLIYLISKYKQTGNKSKVIEIIKCGQRIDKERIDEIFGN